MKYLDPVSLAKIKNLRFQFRRLVVEGHLSGAHASAVRGFSQEFATHREYVPGDELKFLDWKVYARKDRFFVKEFHEEKSLRTYILVDGSGSMGFAGAGRPPKWDYACRLAVGMAYCILARSDEVGLMCFADKASTFLPPRGQMPHLEFVDAGLAALQPAGPTRLAGVVREFATRLPRRSLIVLVSDLLGDPEGNLALLKALRAQKHELMVLQVLDPDERDLPWDGPIKLRDMETGGELSCEVGAVREAYREAFQRMLRLYESTCHGSEIAYEACFTSRPWEETLTRFLGRQLSM